MTNALLGHFVHPRSYGLNASGKGKSELHRLEPKSRGAGAERSEVMEQTSITCRSLYLQAESLLM